MLTHGRQRSASDRGWVPTFRPIHARASRGAWWDSVMGSLDATVRHGVGSVLTDRPKSCAERTKRARQRHAGGAATPRRMMRQLHLRSVLLLTCRVAPVWYKVQAVLLTLACSTGGIRRRPS